MTPTQKNVTEEEYHECSSSRCKFCYRTFYIMACGWDVSRAVECPHCEELHIFGRMHRDTNQPPAPAWQRKI